MACAMFGRPSFIGRRFTSLDQCILFERPRDSMLAFRCDSMIATVLSTKKSCLTNGFRCRRLCELPSINSAAEPKTCGQAGANYVPCMSSTCDIRSRCIRCMKIPRRPRSPGPSSGQDADPEPLRIRRSGEAVSLYESEAMTHCRASKGTSLQLTPVFSATSLNQSETFA